MKLKIMTSEAVAYVKKNISSLTFHYKNEDEPEVWIKKELGKPAFVEVDSLEFPDFSLLIDEEKPSSTDIENIKLLYSSMIKLNDSFATDERLWAGLSHTLFYPYMIKRWPDSNDEKSILNHFFFSSGKPRCYMINTLARLWWIGKQTYLDDEEDHYKILDYIAHDLNGYSFTLYGSNWSNSKNTLKMFFNALFAYEADTGNKVKRGLFNDTMQHMNALCGIYMMDFCDKDFIKNKLYSYISRRYVELENESKRNKADNIRSTGIDRLDMIISSINMSGGVATVPEIIKNHEIILGNKLSSANINYIKDKLKENCPDESAYSGKPLFHKVKSNGITKIKISSDYLMKSKMDNMKSFITDQINSLTENEKVIFNIITSFKKDKFSEDDVLFFKANLSQLYPEISNIESFIKKNLSRIYEKGIIEKIGTDDYKKSYKY